MPHTPVQATPGARPARPGAERTRHAEGHRPQCAKQCEREQRAQNAASVPRHHGKKPRFGVTLSFLYCFCAFFLFQSEWNLGLCACTAFMSFRLAKLRVVKLVGFGAKQHLTESKCWRTKAAG